MLRRLRRSWRVFKAYLMAWLPGHLIRRLAKLHEVPVTKYRVRLARTTEELVQAFTLLHDCYVRRGIMPASPNRLRALPQHVLKESQVMVALYEGEVVATLTTSLDTEAGLPLDKDYGAALDVLRTSGSRIVEYNSLAISPEHRSHGLSILLFNAAHWFACRVQHATHIVCGTHPRALPLYRALFAFDRLGDARPHALLDAPVVGMVQTTASIEAHFRRYHRNVRVETGQSIYELYFEQLPPSIEIEADAPKRTRDSWRLPREVFREVFMRRTTRLEDLNTATRLCLEEQRTENTLLDQADVVRSLQAASLAKSAPAKLVRSA